MMEVNFVKRNESMQKLDYQEIEIGDGLNWFLLCSITSSLRGKETDDRCSTLVSFVDFVRWFICFFRSFFVLSLLIINGRVLTVNLAINYPFLMICISRFFGQTIKIQSDFTNKNLNFDRTAADRVIKLFCVFYRLFLFSFL